jgi:hypothetical protein
VWLKRFCGASFHAESMALCPGTKRAPISGDPLPTLQVDQLHFQEPD